MLRIVPIMMIAFLVSCSSHLKSDIASEQPAPADSSNSDGRAPVYGPFPAKNPGTDIVPQTAPSSGATVQQEIQPGQAGSVQNAGATATFTGTEVSQPTTVGIQALAQADLPALDAGMTNVTKGPSTGFRFTPTPRKFGASFTVSVPYDASLLLPGMSANDIQTFYYDVVQQHWVALEKISVDSENGLIISKTDHFTDMINATITVPDHPEAISFNPNQIKDIKAADPGSEINLIEPPKANNTGDARLSYPIEIPPGRHGLQPELQVAYSSAGGNGWMGIGWDISPKTIMVDTRWGVPRYDAGLETETYTLNGEQLTPVAHRSGYQPRAAEKIFHTRIEGQFQRIVRHGSSPTDYTWEITDKNGTKYIYGANDPGTQTLRDGNGNRFLWALSETRDTNGNFVRYQYAFVNHSGVPGGSLGSNLYLQSINYTGFASAPGAYTVTFYRDSELGEGTRPDIQIDARGGFKRVTADLLRRIRVTYNSQLVRRYDFRYNENPFGDGRPALAFNKTLLTSINQYDANNQFFNKHTLTYYDEARDTAGNYNGFAAVTGWNVGSDGVSAGLLGRGGASAIGGTKGTSGGGHFYVGAGLGLNILSKDFTVGVRAAFNLSSSETLIALTDVNGDGLPDKVFKSGGGYYYRPNLATPSSIGNFGSAMGIPSLAALGRESGISTTFGVDAYIAIVPLAAETTSATTQSDSYLTDVNGDGITDVVNGGQVQFGYLSGGSPAFSANSADTPVAVGGGAINLGNIFANAAAVEAERAQKFPLVDTLRRWVAPYSGTVRIDGAVQLVQDTGPARAQYTKADGVRVAVQLENAELTSLIITESDYALHTLNGISSVAVNRGDRIYFRVGSRFDGAYDQVAWDPKITYLSVNSGSFDASRTDVNDLREYEYRHGADFTLGGRSAQVILPVTGRMHIGGSFTKSGPTSDDVTLVITRNGVDVFRQTFGYADTVSLPLSIDNVMVTQLDTMEWKILTDSPIDATKVSLVPAAWYVEAPGIEPIIDEQGNYVIQVTGIYSVDLYPTRLTANATGAPVNPTEPQNFYSVPASNPDTRSTTVTAVIEFTGLETGEVKSGVLTVKKRGALLAKQAITATGINTATPVTVAVATNATITTGDQIFFEISSRDQTFTSKITQTSVMMGAVAVPAAFYLSSSEGLFPIPYRGWGVAAYNGNFPRDTAAIDQSLLVFSESQTAETTFAYSLAPQPFNNRWVAIDEAVHLGSAIIASSRFGLKDIRVPTGAQFAGAGAPPRISESNSTAETVAVYSQSNGTSRSLVDFTDLNGDRFPDVISGSGVQYTTPTGGFESGQRPVLSGAREGTSITKSFSLSSGGVARSIGNAKAMLAPSGSGSASTAQQGSDSPAYIGGDLGSASSQASFELIDINGDGLPDKVYRDGTAQLNYGYSFGGVENWGGGIISDGQTSNEGLNMGFSIMNGSFSGGLNLATSTTTSNEVYMDINGDGLADKIGAGSPMQVRLNTGTGFTGWITWPGGHGDVAVDKNISLGGGASATGGVPLVLPVPVAKLIFSGGANYSTSMGRPELTFRDVDGDGYPDHIRSRSDSELGVAANPIGRTNMLKAVSRPLGATITMEYTRDGNTYELPQSRWNLTKVIVFDGHVGEGADTQITAFEYQNPHHDRLERDFFGYANVIERQLDTQVANTLYRSISRTFSNDSYYSKGLLRKEQVSDSGGNLFTETENTYILFNVDSQSVLSTSSTTATVFPQLVRTDKRFYEGLGSAQKTTATLNEYDSMGNIVKFIDYGDIVASDDVVANITYTACGDSYIYKPQTITVYGGGNLTRHRESTIDCATGDVTQIRQFIDASNSAVTDLAYEANGNLKQVVGPANKSGQRYTLNYTYDAAVQTHVSQIIDSFGLTSIADYDFRFGKPTVTTDTNGQRMTYNYDSAGRTDSLIGPYEQGTGLYTINFSYYPDASVPYAVTQHVDRDANGALKYTGTIDTILFVDGLKRVLQTKKDAAVHTNPNSNPHESMIVTGQVVFDAFGRTVRQYYPVTEAKGAGNYSYNIAQDAVAPTINYFDVLDRTVQTVLPDTTTTTSAYGFGYDRASLVQFQTLVTDANGKQKVSYRDVRGLITSIKEFNADQTIQTSYEYDALKQIVRVVDDKFNSTLISYDNLGRRTRIDNPDAGLTETVYDPAGNMIAKITANLRADNKQIDYDYDFNRLVKIRYPIFQENNVTYQYGSADAGGNANGNRAGRVTMVTDASGTEERFYGPLGETTKEVKTIPSLWAWGHVDRVYVTEYQYDTWNRLLQLTYPGVEDVPDHGSHWTWSWSWPWSWWPFRPHRHATTREVLTYSYDSGGLVTSAVGRKAMRTYPYLSRLDYDKFGQRIYQELGNGVKTNYAYRADNRRLANLQSQLPSPSQYQFQNLNYSYDAVGNITQISNGVALPDTLTGAAGKVGNRVGGPSTQDFAYDDLYRLTSATGTYDKSPFFKNRYSVNMSYDTVHNITQKKQLNEFVDIAAHAHPIFETTYLNNYYYNGPKPHGASDVGVHENLYDDNGNLVRREHRYNHQTRHMIWDEENRLACVRENWHGYLPQKPYSCFGPATRFVYNAAGTRVVKDGFAMQFSINQHFTQRGPWTFKHIFVGQQRLVTKRAETGNLREPLSWFYHPDHLSSTSYLTNANGKLEEYLGYFPSGESWVTEHSTQPIQYQFTGKEYDAETGLYYFGARYYDPRVSAWVSTDPALDKYLPSSDQLRTLELSTTVSEKKEKKTFDAFRELPGLGGVFNPSNLGVYGYAHHNPIKLSDPDGRIVIAIPILAKLAFDAAVTVVTVMLAKDAYDKHQEKAQATAITDVGQNQGGEFTVRIQAQGGGLEQSEVIHKDKPVTAQEALSALGVLKGKLSKSDLAARQSAFEKAEKFIQGAAASGGTTPTRRSFPGKSDKGKNDVRVDVEVLRGPVNLVP